MDLAGNEIAKLMGLHGGPLVSFEVTTLNVSLNLNLKFELEFKSEFETEFKSEF